MSGTLTIGAAFLLGLVASGHCLVMCGGISAALGVATGKTTTGRPRLELLVGYQLGRIVSYALAGALLAGLLDGLAGWLRIEAVRHTLRIFSGLALLVGAGVIFRQIRDPGFGPASRLWRKLAPLGRKLLPVTSLPRAVAFGMVWGWMPCGFVYMVLLIATLQADAAQGALTMIAFGLGTAPALLATAFGGQRLVARAAVSARQVGGTILLASAALTLAGPWLVQLLPGVHEYLLLGCARVLGLH